MKAREKRRRRALRTQRKRCEARLAEYWGDCLTNEPMYGEEGYVGDHPQPLEYPCNCYNCRGCPAEPWPGPVSWDCGECDPEFPCWELSEHCIRYAPEVEELGSYTREELHELIIEKWGHLF